MPIEDWVIPYPGGSYNQHKNRIQTLVEKEEMTLSEAAIHYYTEELAGKESEPLSPDDFKRELYIREVTEGEQMSLSDFDFDSSQDGGT